VPLIVLLHKTLYIDVDEEITSIVDRLRKAQAPEIIVVAPKRALLIQSLVNLKLLKKEANRRKKRLIIVTQDRIGKKLIEKVGIQTQGKIDNPSIEEEIFKDVSKKNQPEILEETLEENSFGSSDYFDEPLPAPISDFSSGMEKQKEESVKQTNFSKKKESEYNSEVGLQGIKKTDKEIKLKRKETERENKIKLSDIVADTRKEKKEKPVSKKIAGTKRKEALLSESYFHKREMERQRELKPENFFQASNFDPLSFSSRKREKALKTTRVKGRAGKYFVIFLILFFLFWAAASAYFFLPQATIILHMKMEEKSASLTVEANVSESKVDQENKKIPAVLEEMTKEKSGEFEATGSQSGVGKAGGKVVIYNEFSSENQPLVATTRLETSDGKIFRITKNVIVPGMTKIGGETKPGAIEVEVVADQSGEEYNIGPTSFKIPGFKGGPKYEKFHAESSRAMEGGSKTGSSLVTSKDLAAAKENLVAMAKKEALEELKSKMGEGQYFFEDTALFSVINSSSSESIGAKAQKFTYTVTVKGQVLSFREDDVKELISADEKANGADSTQINFEKGINYILSESDVEKGFLKFEAKTDFYSTPALDVSNFKKGVLGKNTEELEGLIKNYPAVKNADVNFWPFFVNRVPMDESRVKIEIR
jgi:hypothetical protein